MRQEHTTDHSKTHISPHTHQHTSPSTSLNTTISPHSTRMPSLIHRIQQGHTNTRQATLLDQLFISNNIKVKAND